MWTYVVGSLVVNTSTYKESEKTIQDYLESLLETSGCEGGCQYHVHQLNGWNVTGRDDEGNLIYYQTKFTISIVGYLRDVHAEEINQEILYILKRIYVDKFDIEMCSISIHDSVDSVHILKSNYEKKLECLIQKFGKQKRKILELE